jgi:hypothetical protein
VKASHKRFVIAFSRGSPRQPVKVCAGWLPVAMPASEAMAGPWQNTARTFDVRVPARGDFDFIVPAARCTGSHVGSA